MMKLVLSIFASSDLPKTEVGHKPRAISGSGHTVALPLISPLI
jgi:hypothetical protein